MLRRNIVEGKAKYIIGGFVILTELRMMELVGHGINEKRIQTSLRKSKGRIHVQEIGLNGSIILKYILEK
jgi:hypothetical protein